MVGNRKGRWILDEDRLLIRLVDEYSVDGEDIDWSVLEQHFKGTRDSKQIRERWVNHLNPRIKKRKFSDEEIKIIEDECSKHKFKWARIAKKIPNATPLMIKNFYNNRLKKKNPANRRLSTSANITPFTINNFNHNPITSTTTTKSTEQDYSYYSESNLKRSDSARTVVAEEGSYSTKAMIAESNYSTTNLSRHSSIRSIMSNSSATTVVENEQEYDKHQFFTTQMSSSQLPSPPPSAENGKLNFLATVANIMSQSELSSTTAPSSPKKSGKMSIMNLLS
ncbi:10239_t:CDS:2 [Rhizophagus irregularis]|nr:10239_t:CDS:2 [Rhizophagus irregularis]